jgi:hypothetical protein
LSFLGALLALAGPAQARQAGEVGPVGPVGQVELVLVLDTTGSMGGLIERAKSELWGIVDQLSANDPNASIRLGLVGFRDRGDAYVTQVFDLSADIDAAYQKLVSFRAEGGGDTPESVNAALAEAVGQIAWTGGVDTRRAIVLAGDAPPHMDYADDVPWSQSAGDARSRGIAIHAIQCGGNAETREVWQQIARVGGGTYGAIASNPDAAAGSPWDEQLAALNRALAGTVVPFGNSVTRDRVRAAVDLTKATDAATAASRVSFLGRRGEAATAEDGDLVRGLQRGDVAWDDLDAESLPEHLRGLTAEELKQYLEDQLGRRRGLLSEVAYYANQRDAYLEQQRSKDPAAAFQRQVVDALSRAASR